MTRALDENLIQNKFIINEHLKCHLERKSVVIVGIIDDMLRRRHVAVISEIKMASWVTNVQSQANYALTCYSSIDLHITSCVHNQSEYFIGPAYASNSSSKCKAAVRAFHHQLTSAGCIFVAGPLVRLRDLLHAKYKAGELAHYIY